MKKTTLATILIGEHTVDIIATRHANIRMHQRKVDPLLIISGVASVPSKDINQMMKKKTAAMVLDETNNLGIVFTIENKQIVIITVIQKKNIYVKKNTKVIAI